MNYLREFDITDDIIESIKKNNDEAVVQGLIYAEENVKEVIKYFKTINILVINELLISRPEVFTINCDKLKLEFNKYNIEVLVNLINEDLNAINFL